MAQFKKRVFGANVPYDVQMDFQKLASGGINRTKIRDKEGNPIILKGKGAALEEINPSFENYLGDRTPFSRMWCAVNINTLDEIPPNGEIVERHEEGFYFYVPKGKDDAERVKVGHDKNSHTRVFVVNENTEESHVNNNPLDSIQSTGMKSLQQITQLGHNPLMKPSAGITSVTSKTQGALGALRNTTVEFVVHNRHDFENIFLPYFLKPGSIVCVDYGWSDIVNSLYNPIDQIKDKPLDMSEFDEFIYKENGFLAKNYGKVNTTMGNVVSYEANITPEGSYNCSLEIVSRNTSLLDKEISDDNQLKFVFSNAINDILIEVLAAAATSGSAVPMSYQQIEDNMGSLEPNQREEIITQFHLIENESQDIGDISETSLKTGIFHEDMTFHVFDKRNKVRTKKMNNHQEMTYISYGLFEDLFLTNFVAGTIPTETTEDSDKNKKSVSFTKNPSRDFSNRYDSRTSYIRWDQNLSEISKQELAPDENLSSFIIPNNWDESYNSNKLGDEFVSTDDCIGGNHPDYLNIAVMPLRDLFINVPLITEAFKKKSTVNDVILFILDTLNSESHKVWNLKISSDMTSQSNISITDTNLNPEIEEEENMLIFNVMGETSIVSQCDLRFTTPKAGLSSMIAIGNLHGPQRFEQLDLSALNNLNLLNRPEEKANLPTIVKSLPLQGVTNKQMTQPAARIDFSKFIKSNNIELGEGVKKTIRGKYETYLSTAKSFKKAEKSKKSSETKKFIKKPSEATLVTSDRGLLKEKIRTKYYDASGPNTIAPILPVELTLSVYGNNFLQIGDYYTINYLPSYYKNKIFFQVAGIEDKIDVNGWTTTYDPSIMRVRPDQKELITGKQAQAKQILISPEARPLLNAGYKYQGIYESGRSYGGDFDYESVIDSYTDGVDKYNIRFEAHEVQFEVYRHVIRPNSQWKKVEEPGVDEIVGFHTSVADETGIKDISNLSFSCALRDVLLNEELSPFKADDIAFAKPFSETQEQIFRNLKNNKNKMVFAPILDQVSVLNHTFSLFGFEFQSSTLSGGATEKKEGIIAETLQSVSPTQNGYYVVSDEDMFVNIKVEDYYWFEFTKTDMSYNLPKFISKYFFSINIDLDEPQNLYELEVSGPTIFQKIYLPEHLMLKKEGSTVELFIENLRAVYNKYYNVLDEFKQKREVNSISRYI